MSTIEEWVDKYVIPNAESRFFVEIGAAHNTHLGSLVRQKGWNGVRIDRTVWPGVEQHIVTKENINSILGSRVPDVFDLLLIDIDGNDYHVWEAIEKQPRAVIIEYNAFAPAGWIIPYDPDHYYAGDDWFGADLRAMTKLAHSRGMVLMECDNQGANALFLPRDLDVAHKWRPLTYAALSHSPKWKD